MIKTVSVQLNYAVKAVAIGTQTNELLTSEPMNYT
jgi:hypothetical protein